MASTRSTVSDASPARVSVFPFEWESVPGHAVRLLERNRPKPGVVLSLGCGLAPEADPLTVRGYEYVGLDDDREALAKVSSRGFETHVLDLTSFAPLPARLLGLVRMRHVAAVFALDALAAVDDTSGFLAALRDALDRLGRPPLIVSVPNIARVDLAAELVFGRWHRSGSGDANGGFEKSFTAARLRRETRAAGLIEVDAHDLSAPLGERPLPGGLSALALDSPPVELVRALRETAGPHASTTEFVRSFVVADLEVEARDADRQPTARKIGAPPLTVVVRTQGTRPVSLQDTLTCLAAQTTDAFDVLLTVHNDDPEVVTAVRAQADEFEPAFAERVTVVAVPSRGGRARPLNVALERLRSDYVSFLDDDDLVTAHWVEAFCDAAGGGAVVRSASARRFVASAPKPAVAPYLIRTALEFPFSVEFEMAEHLWQNQTPICAMAIPRALIETFALRFDEQFSVLEDWDFLLRCASLAPVRDTRLVTSIVQVWLQGESSRSLHSAELWLSLERVLRERMNARPVVLPPGSVMQVVDVYRARAELRVALSAAESRAAELVAARAMLEQELEQRQAQLEGLQARYQAVIESKRWRLLVPVARTAEVTRRLRGRRGADAPNARRS